MGVLIRIKDKVEHFLKVDLQDVLNILKPFGERLSWSILDFYGRGHLPDGESILDFENKIQEAPEGIAVDWDMLIKYAAAFEDIYDIVVAGYEKRGYTPKLGPEYPVEGLYENCVFVLRLVDSSYWEIYLEDEKKLELFSVVFSNVEISRLDLRS